MGKKKRGGKWNSFGREEPALVALPTARPDLRLSTPRGTMLRLCGCHNLPHFKTEAAAGNHSLLSTTRNAIPPFLFLPSPQRDFALLKAVLTVQNASYRGARGICWDTEEPVARTGVHGESTDSSQHVVRKTKGPGFIWGFSRAPLCCRAPRRGRETRKQLGSQQGGLGSCHHPLPAAWCGAEPQGTWAERGCGAGGSFGGGRAPGCDASAVMRRKSHLWRGEGRAGVVIPWFGWRRTQPGCAVDALRPVGRCPANTTAMPRDLPGAKSPSPPTLPPLPMPWHSSWPPLTLPGQSHVWG